MAVIFHERLYTTVTMMFFFLSFLVVIYSKMTDKLGYFYFAYIIHIIPFLIVNGILTAMPIVIYNNLENLGVRIYTIPIEDTAYSMLLLLMNILIFEKLNSINSLKTNLSL
jgi:lycopene cyclase domain-containing protein